MLRVITKRRKTTRSRLYHQTKTPKGTSIQQNNSSLIGVQCLAYIGILNPNLTSIENSNCVITKIIPDLNKILKILIKYWGLK